MRSDTLIYNLLKHCSYLVNNFEYNKFLLGKISQ